MYIHIYVYWYKKIQMIFRTIYIFLMKFCLLLVIVHEYISSCLNKQIKTLAIVELIKEEKHTEQRKTK